MHRFPAPMAVAPHPNPHWHISRPPKNPQWRPNSRIRPPYRPPNTNIGGNQRIMTPGNCNYWCETCDRGFPNEDFLNKHKQEHQKCNIDGCQFIAHPKVITKHIQMQHSSGLYKKIAKLNNPEEIEKWREERRKKYPTKANIEKKVAAVKEKIERGEKMGLKTKNNKQNNPKEFKGQGVKRKNSTSNEYQNNSTFKRIKENKILESNHQNRKPRPKKPETIPAVEENRKLKPFAGIQNLIEEDSSVKDTVSKCHDLIEDEDVEIQDKIEENRMKPTLCGALSSLICDYGSSDDEHENLDVQNKKLNENGNSINTVHEVKQTIKENSNSIKKLDTSTENQIGESTNMVSNENQDEDSSPEEAKVEKNDKLISRQEPVNHTQKMVKKRIENKQIFRRPKPKLPSTLLYKLLSKELQQERNIVLQCIRFIRKNNYFNNKHNTN